MTNRRGAIIVTTGIMIVAIMIFIAISLDASRIFAAKNELQTAADAAALAGAVQLLDDENRAADTVRAYARLNRVENRLIDSVRIRIAYGVWFPATRTFDSSANPVDAVRVTVSHKLPLSLARVFGDSTVTVTSSATAWSSGPVVESTCAKPLALPYSSLLDKLSLPEGSELTDYHIRRLRDMSVVERDTFFHYGHNPATDNDEGDAASNSDDDEYFPVDTDSTWNPSDPYASRPNIDAEFESYMIDPPPDGDGRCALTASPDDIVRTEPGNKAQAIRDGLERLCSAREGTFSDGRCQRDGQTLGIPVKVLFWTGVPEWNDDGTRAYLRVKMTGAFVIREIANADSPDPLDRAKMFGYFDVQRDFGRIASGGASMLLRPMLVR